MKFHFSHAIIYCLNINYTLLFFIFFVIEKDSVELFISCNIRTKATKSDLYTYWHYSQICIKSMPLSKIKFRTLRCFLFFNIEIFSRHQPAVSLYHNQHNSPQTHRQWLGVSEGSLRDWGGQAGDECYGLQTGGPDDPRAAGRGSEVFNGHSHLRE